MEKNHIKTNLVLDSLRSKLFRNLKEYQEYELKDIATINKGKQLNKELMDDSGKYYVLNGGKSPSGFTETWNVEGNTITISEGGESCGYVNYNRENFYCGGTVII